MCGNQGFAHSVFDEDILSTLHFNNNNNNNNNVHKPDDILPMINLLDADFCTADELLCDESLLQSQIEDLDRFLNGEPDALSVLGVALDLLPAAEAAGAAPADPLLHLEPALLSRFPHIADERNLKRRPLLYESAAPPPPPARHPSALSTHDYALSARRAPDTEARCFPCSVANCAKVYSKFSHLRAHLKRHSGEKPFACNWENCAWKFSRSDELARHKRSHSGIKPYKCDLCERAFARSDHLAKHHRVHKKKMAQYGTYHIRRGR